MLNMRFAQILGSQVGPKGLWNNPLAPSHDKCCPGSHTNNISHNHTQGNLIHNSKHPCVLGPRGAIPVPNDSVICDVLTCNVSENLGQICLKDVCQLRCHSTLLPSALYSSTSEDLSHSYQRSIFIAFLFCLRLLFYYEHIFQTAQHCKNDCKMAPKWIFYCTW